MIADTMSPSAAFSAFTAFVLDTPAYVQKYCRLEGAKQV